MQTGLADGLAGATSYAGGSGLKPATIYNDTGGQAMRYALKAQEYQKQRRQVRFAGRCDSACTLYLSLPDDLVCISSGASFGFHRPYGATLGENRVMEEYMMGLYPEWVRDWIESQGGLAVEMKSMNYAYASQFMRPCESARSI